MGVRFKSIMNWKILRTRVIVSVIVVAGLATGRYVRLISSHLPNRVELRTADELFARDDTVGQLLFIARNDCPACAMVDPPGNNWRHGLPRRRWSVISHRPLTRVLETPWTLVKYTTKLRREAPFWMLGWMPYLPQLSLIGRERLCLTR